MTTTAKPNGISIRSLRIRDLKGINRMGSSFPMPLFRTPKPYRIRWLAANLGLLMSTSRTLRHLLLLIFPRQAFLSFVAVTDEDQILGFAFLLIKRIPPKGNLTGRLVIGTKVQGQGIGDQMLEALVTQAQQGGISRVTLDVSCGNARAISLYERFGFKAKRITMSLDLKQ